MSTVGRNVPMTFKKSATIVLISLILVMMVPTGTPEPSCLVTDSFLEAQSKYRVTVNITRVHVIEDRDFLDAEIYIRVSIDGGTELRSTTRTGITDGDIIHYNWLVFDSYRRNYSVRVEVWEEDEDFDGYLGHVDYFRNQPINVTEWHDCEGSIGGNNDLQARVEIKEIVFKSPYPDVSSPPNKEFTEGTTDHIIRWVAFDDSPDKYVITRDGEMINTDTWVSEEPIICSVDSLSVGSYSYKIVVNNTDGYEAEDVVLVTVIEPTPTTTETTTESTDVSVTSTESTTPTDTEPIPESPWPFELTPVVVAYGTIMVGAMIMIVYFGRKRSPHRGWLWPKSE